MRTYKRKRPEYQAIEGVEALCRLCLGSKEVTVPIFGEDADQLCALSMRIMICVGLEMSRDNNLPNAICLGCYKELERYYTFRKKCEVTYQKLKAHVLAIKEGDSNMTKMKPKVEDENEKPVDSCAEEQHQLVLTFDENQQIQLVNFVNSSTVSLADNEALLTTTTLEELSNVIVQSQDEENHTINESTQNDTISLEHIPASSLDVNLMSTLLLELGVLRQVEDRLVLADSELNIVELEGVDNTKIVLQLVEEDEEENVEAEVEKLCTQNNSDSVGTLNKRRKDLTCPECNKWFASRGALTRHARVHSGAKPYACGVCARRFAQRAVLTRHEHVHKEKRPFPCTQCPKSFTQRGALDAHARRHAPPHARPLALHACAACDKVFLYASGLSRHMSVHSGRRYACARCSRAFADSSALARHARRHPPPHPHPHPHPHPPDPRGLDE